MKEIESLMVGGRAFTKTGNLVAATAASHLGEVDAWLDRLDEEQGT